jgi:4-aminobutyrate aminotransferase-like enzyme
MGGVQKICRDHGILLISDEIQAGMGRTGKWFGFQHFGVEPDVIVLAKGLASGFPLSGIAAPSALMEKWIPGSHGGTFGGNAVGCAAAAATIRVLKEEDLPGNSARMGAELLAELRALQQRFPVLGDVRGLGLMVGAEFSTPAGEPDKATAKAVQKHCLDGGLMLLTCGTYGNVIRWIPPLIINDSHLAEALAIFERALETVSG